MSLVVEKNENVCGLHTKGLVYNIPPQPEPEGGTRDAARPRYSARARNFRLILSTSVVDGGLAWARFRAEDRIVDATKRDPRLP